MTAKGQGFVQRAIVAALTRERTANVDTLTRASYPDHPGEFTRFQLLAVKRAIRQLVDDKFIRLAPVNTWSSYREPRYRLGDPKLRETGKTELRPDQKPLKVVR
jgi:hypothetical protein